MPAETSVEWQTPIGLQRGKAVANDLAGDGRGRGGAISMKTKVAVRDLVTEDAIPIRDVPKAIVDFFVLLIFATLTRFGYIHLRMLYFV